MLKIGIVGLGAMGRNHLRVLSNLAGIKVQGIYDIDRASAKTLARNFSTISYADYMSLLNDIDCIVISSPTTLHYEHLVQASKKLNNIFVEKPICENIQKTKKILSLNIPNLQVGFIERYNPAIQELKKITDKTKPFSIDFSRTNKISSRIKDVDVVTDLMIHDIDLALFLNGSIKEIYSKGIIVDGTICWASAIITHENQVISRIEASKITEKKIRSINASFENLFVDCDLLKKEIKLIKNTHTKSSPLEPYRITSVEETLEVQPREALQEELIDFIESCKEAKKFSLFRPVGNDGLSAIEVCQRIQSQIFGDRL